ncbi:MAG: HD domain-containing protein [Candidatus Wildermuthbacteria bacterium]|nr:HD domain-containing protein [Candidatus Wildermuthbacteria bacterium]
MNEEVIVKTDEFLALEFQKHPHYSFNDWTVMYDHSRKVLDIALQIAEDISCDKIVVAIGALLHDIGKTYETDAETLHKRHEEFNLLVSEEFLDSLSLPKEQLQRAKEVVSHKSDSVEMKIVEDADALALYGDKRLYTLYIQWARKNSLADAIQRKLDKFSKLNFERSRDLGEEWYDNMKKDWGV